MMPPTSRALSSQLTLDQALPTLEHARDRDTLIERTARDRRIAAFMPGASPPLVRTAMCFISARL
jgi:hypothetical protein